MNCGYDPQNSVLLEEIPLQTPAVAVDNQCRSMRSSLFWQNAVANDFGSGGEVSTALDLDFSNSSILVFLYSPQSYIITNEHTNSSGLY